MFWNREPKKFNILITGAKGQLGSYLANVYKKLAYMQDSHIGLIFEIDKSDLDLKNHNLVMNYISYMKKYSKLDYVINCAAATDTTAIAKDPFKFYADNCLAPRNVAEACYLNKIKLIHISTDYVFSEYSNTQEAFGQEFPVNQYGMQKLLAEQFIQNVYHNRPQDLMILRSSWMFGNSNKSFVEKFIKNVFKTYKSEIAKGKLDNEKIPIKVANDAYGKPTHVKFISELIIKLIEKKFYGICDCQEVGSQISRAVWAKQILGIFRRKAIEIRHSNDLYENVANILESVEVKPCSSDELNLIEKHPGKAYNQYGYGIIYSDKAKCLENYKQIIDNLSNNNDLTWTYIITNFNKLCLLLDF